MFDLIRAEVRRFSRWILLATFVHLLLLQFMNRVADMLNQNYETDTTLVAVYAFLAMTFALYQMGGYTKPNQWLWLIHRPLSVSRIFLALFSAALFVLVVVILLPMLLALLLMDTLSDRIVDSRHYASVLHVFGVTVMAWLAGAYAMLSRHKTAIVVTIVPIALAFHVMSVGGLLLLNMGGVLWLLLITLNRFQADRSAPIKHPFVLLMSALPLQLGYFLLVFTVGEFAFQAIWLVSGQHPQQTREPPANSLIVAERANAQQIFELGLAQSTHVDKDDWLQQLSLIEPISLQAHLTRYPFAQQISSLRSSQWSDGERGIEWTFSHDAMMFHGLDMRSRADRGWFGVNGTHHPQPFSELPFVLEGQRLMTRQHIYQIAEDGQTVYPVLALDSGEVFVAQPVFHRDQLLVLTSTSLRVYEPDRRQSSLTAPMKLQWQFALPHGADDLMRVDVARMLDGQLLSLVYGDNYDERITTPSHQIVFVHDDGSQHVVSEREYQNNYPDLTRNAWWFSPLLHNFSRLPEVLFEKGFRTRPTFEWRAAAPSYYGVAIVLALLSLLVAAYWLRHVPWQHLRKKWWLLSCALLGVPALLSLLTLYHRDDRL